MLKTPATIAKVETMSDGGIKLTVHTQELVPSDKAELMALHNSIGHFVFAPQDQAITESDIPDEQIEFNNQKTPSERLRNVLYILHEKQKGRPEEFEAFRVKYMERLINKTKERIDDIP